MNPIRDLQVFGEHARSMSIRRHKEGCPALPVHGGPRPHRHACDGCITDAERALWARLADEVDQYLTPPPDDTLPMAHWATGGPVEDPAMENWTEPVRESVVYPDGTIRCETRGDQ